MTDNTAPEFPKSWPERVWTTEEWNAAMLARLDRWLTLPRPKPPILKFMHMNANGFIYWRETKVVPRETRVLYTIFPEYLNE